MKMYRLCTPSFSKNILAESMHLNSSCAVGAFAACLWEGLPSNMYACLHSSRSVGAFVKSSLPKFTQQNLRKSKKNSRSPAPRKGQRQPEHGHDAPREFQQQPRQQQSWCLPAAKTFCQLRIIDVVIARCRRTNADDFCTQCDLQFRCANARELRPQRGIQPWS